MQTLFLPMLTREQGYCFLRILAALLEFLSVEAHAVGVQMEILLWRSSLRPWLGRAAYGSFVHHAQPAQAATNIQPAAQLLAHSPGASLRLLACHLFMPLWERRFLPSFMYRKGVFLILPEAGSQWQFKYFFYYLGPVVSIHTSVLSSTQGQGIFFFTIQKGFFVPESLHYLYWLHTVKWKNVVARNQF